MVLLEFVAHLLAGVAVMIVLAGGVFLETEQTIAGVDGLRRRTKVIAPHLALVAGTVLVNRVFRNIGQELSWLIGLNITGTIYAIEGDFVAAIQSVASPSLTAFFSFLYLYGYVFLTVFPIIAYFVLRDADPIRKALVAYALNYGIGIVCYTLFISFGPRNLLPDTVREMLYATYPKSQLLTSAVNANTNAFPSLHTSLSVTVALLAYQTRDHYPGWAKLAGITATLVVVSTMYLGIHWATDVVAGIVLAVVSVRLANRYYELPAISWSRSDEIEIAGGESR